MNVKAPVLVLVVNNASYRVLKLIWNRWGGPWGESQALPPGLNFGEPKIDFTKLADSMGMVGERVSKTSELRGAVERGLAAGAAVLILVSAAMRDRPWIDRRAATLDALWDWQPGRITGPQGAPVLASLALPFELPRAPWVFDPGERRNSRRMDVPPGRYLFEAAIRPAAPPARVRIELGSDPLVFAEAELDQARTSVSVPVLLPAGARHLGISAAGLDGRAELDEARLVPEALVPRKDRGRFNWPEFADDARYRVAGGRLRVTVLDRSAPEVGGFRLDRVQGDLVVDGAVEAVAEVHVRRARPSRADTLEWGGHGIPLGPLPEVRLQLPMSDGMRLGTDAVVPVRMRAEGAWIRVSEAPVR
jgi:hypothetical protein